ncbi:MAG TPA: hypothetical protein PKK99_14630, partial [Bacteroidia bacterium]|nr:hypothetical protein [Bacteroidia bacterium]
MKKKSIGVKSRQRQKMTRRTIIILAASCFLLIGGGLTLFFNLTQVDNTRAKDSQTINVIMVPDFKPVNEKELAAPFVDPK